MRFAKHVPATRSWRQLWILPLLPGISGLGPPCLQLGLRVSGLLGLGFQTIKKNKPSKKLVFPLTQISKMKRKCILLLEA